MKAAVYFPLVTLIFFLQACIASARITYDGLALTSIDVVPSPKGGNWVRFSGSIEGSAADKNIKQINNKDESGQRLFEAERVTVREAKQIIEDSKRGKPLFCIHGFTVQPGDHLKILNNAASKFNQGKFMLVPVIWPSAGGGL